MLSYVSSRWIAPRLRTQTEQLGSLTIPDFIGLRYRSTLLRVITAVIVVGASVFYMTAVFRGIGLTVDAFWHTGYEGWWRRRRFTGIFCASPGARQISRA